MLRLRTVTCLLSAGAALVVAPSARAASWQTGVNYGGASGSTKTDFYVPDKVVAKPPVLFSIHYCSGQGANAHSWFQSYADQYGFIIIAPTAHGNCFDANLHRSGEQADFVAMIDYAIMKYSADTTRVYASGLSSGACMVQALLADYPDRFTAGASFAGVPAGAWTGGNDYAWSAPASTTAAQWGDKVRAADPGFTGPRPHIQFWQGQGDTTLTYSQTYPAELAQWTNVFGMTDADAIKTSIKPPGAKNTWARTSYKDCNGNVVVEANSGPSNVTHDLGSEGIWGDGIRFLGLDNGGITLKACAGMGTGGAGGMGAGGSAGANTGGAGSGGKATGGTGNSGTGGTTGGSGGTGPAGTGGTTGSAGMTSGAGMTGTGGSATGTGGSATGTGGSATGTGGSATGTGGTAGKATGTGGTATGTGGSATGSGGKATGTGGTAGTGGPVVADNPTAANDSGGCGCRVAGQSKGGTSALLLVGGLALLSTRRRRRDRG